MIGEPIDNKIRSRLLTAENPPVTRKNKVINPTLNQPSFKDKYSKASASVRDNAGKWFNKLEDKAFEFSEYMADRFRSKPKTNSYTIMAWKIEDVLFAELLPKVTPKEEDYYVSLFENTRTKVPYVLDSFDNIPPKEAIKAVLLALVDGSRRILSTCTKDKSVIHIEKLDAYSG